MVVIATHMFVESFCFATYSAWISSQNAITSAHGALNVVPGTVLDSGFTPHHLPRGTGTILILVFPEGKAATGGAG